MTAHAEKRPPSGAHRWLSCPGSVNVVPLYPNDPSVASTKGDIAHDLLDTAIKFGFVPDHQDIDITYGVLFAYERIMELYKQYKPCKLITDLQVDIPETGEFGTLDVAFVTASLIHIIDYKNGYVPVEVKMNAQLLLYLLGIIAIHGERKHYKISICQPNYPHADGMFRTYEVSHDDLEWFRGEVQYAMLHDHLVAGKHCKTSYCPHRGACEVFLPWAQENLRLAWYSSEFAAMTDEQLAETLDQSDTLKGYDNQLHGEALRRMTNLNRDINGYKIVRARKDREFRNDEARAKVFERLRERGVPEEALYDHTPISVAGVERVVKGMYKGQGHNAWLAGMDEICGKDMLQSQTHTLTVAKSIDGRKTYKKGDEFTPLKQMPDTKALSDIL
jgi:uncharacterized protein YerC